MSACAQQLILVDGSSYLYRAFHALPALTNSKGIPTGAVYGMTNMLRKLIADYHPQFMAVVFDAKGKTFRDEIYEPYKATREAMPHDLVQQVHPINEIIRAMGIPLLVIEGVEADDVIGTLATHATQKGWKAIISTSDKDLAQLVNENVTLINTMTNVHLDRDGVKEKFGVFPEQMIEYLTLVGDSSDNIPGVPLVGPKTAAKWLNQYGSLENIMTNAPKISGKVGENLRHSLSQLPLVNSLVTIKKDVKLPLDFFDLQIKTPEKKHLIQLYTALEFKTWLSELLEESKEEHAAQYENYRILQTESEFLNFVEQLKRRDQFVVTIETNRSNDLFADCVGLSIALEPGRAFYIPVMTDQLKKEVVLTHLKPILENPQIKKTGHNIKYLEEILLHHGIKIQGFVHDVMIASYLLDSSSNAHDLHSLALKYLGWRAISYDEIAGKGSKQLSFDAIDIQKAGLYAAENADISLRLHNILIPRINDIPGLQHVFEHIEMPLVPVLADIEMNGVLIDPIKLERQSKELQKRLTELEQEVFGIAGKAFNMNSPKQLQEILFQTLKLPVLQKTPTGQPSTADQVLQELSLDFLMPRLIIEYRGLAKLISTYTHRLIEQIDPQTGRVHTSYNQAATATGRLSSSDPNLQNIPIRTAEGRRIRQAFIAPKGYQLMSADYSQIELRLMAHISEDPNLLKAFTENLDIHVATAAEVWGVEIEKVTSDMRRNAKAINFGLIYGMSAFGLIRQLGIDRKAAEGYIERYFTRYPKVKNYMENTRNQAKSKGYVETLWGRRLYLPDINASQIPRQRAAERAAINGPLQGSAADIIKLAMIQIHHWLHEEKIQARMIMQVHDELVFEVPEKEFDLVSHTVQQLMTQVVHLKVPLLVSIGTGDNWDSASSH